ncbi:MAG: hypothetical protein OHK0017_12150 [Patescibacteria group bacterium]
MTKVFDKGQKVKYSWQGTEIEAEVIKSTTNPDEELSPNGSEAKVKGDPENPAYLLKILSGHSAGKEVVHKHNSLKKA